MRRRGVTIFELTIAVLLVAVVLSGVAQLLALVSAQHRERERRIAAMHEAANHMERLAALPLSALTEATAAQAALSTEAAALLPDGELTVRVETAEPDVSGATAPPARRLVVAVAWKNASGAAVKPVRLVSWRYSPEVTP
jgi:Tfp pilus assembly protein PilV